MQAFKTQLSESEVNLIIDYIQTAFMKIDVKTKKKIVLAALTPETARAEIYTTSDATSATATPAMARHWQQMSFHPSPETLQTHLK